VSTCTLLVAVLLAGLAAAPASAFETQTLVAYWFAPLVSPDFTPDRLALTSPDGATERFDGASALPAVTHRA
jgi:hypothetical protein